MPLIYKGFSGKFTMKNDQSINQSLLFSSLLFSSLLETLAKNSPNTMIIYHVAAGTSILDTPPMWNKRIHGVLMKNDEYIVTMTQNKQAAHLDP
jgi:hypothetical protein